VLGNNLNMNGMVIPLLLLFGLVLMNLIDKTINGEKIIEDAISEEKDTKDIISMFNNGSRLV